MLDIHQVTMDESIKMAIDGSEFEAKVTSLEAKRLEAEPRPSYRTDFGYHGKLQVTMVFVIDE